MVLYPSRYKYFQLLLSECQIKCQMQIDCKSIHMCSVSADYLSVTVILKQSQGLYL
jgi:hypothetical protein